MNLKVNENKDQFHKRLPDPQSASISSDNSISEFLGEDIFSNASKISNLNKDMSASEKQ